ncbi:NAD(P)/FAD-dependent oxidoreductase [Bordetella hinzii]|uniref:NAD(P)/FAD-dependent oxidoreductase n=1 Tax=Bordetella hinzii TaxID=103855 RepID=UPI0039FC3555
MTETIVIAGAGHAAGKAVRVLREEGHTGRIVLVGEETHLPYERPPLSKEYLNGARTLEQCAVNPAAAYDGVELLLGQRALALDPAGHVLSTTAGMLRYDKLLIATGARARAFPGLPAAHPRVHVLRGADDALRLRQALVPGRHIVLIGGGFIGLEVAATARGLGCEVTVLESADVPLARVTGRQVGRYVESVHRAHGVKLQTGRVVTGVRTHDDGVEVSCQTGETWRADALVVGIGVVPNVELAREAGIECEDGIVVDAHGRSSVPDVYATGDVTSHPNRHYGRRIRLETWENAEKQTVAVCRSMLGRETAYDEIPWMWTDQFGMNLQVVGLPGPVDQAVVRGDPASGRFISLSLHQGCLTFAVLANMGRERRALTTLIANRTPVSVADLANDAINLRDLARQTAAA